MTSVTLYVDGSCPNNGLGGKVMGVGIVAECGPRIYEWGIPIIEKGATCNRAEVTAILLGLSKIPPKSRPFISVSLFSDSQFAIYSLNGVYNPTKFTEANPFLMREVHSLIDEFASVTFNWIKGHSGNRHNERSNILAQQAASGRSYP
jgi:ribonuclease HI